MTTALPDPALLGAGAALLAAGAAFYYFTRADAPLFLQWFAARDFARPLLPNGIGLQWFPSFAHAASFTLLSAAWLPAGVYWLSAALFWFVVNVGFEWMQAWSGPVTNMTEAGWLASLLANYAATGVFDIKDIAAAGVGALAGLAFCQVLDHSRL